jgi:hypothetical protein
VRLPGGAESNQKAVALSNATEIKQLFIRRDEKASFLVPPA